MAVVSTIAEIEEDVVVTDVRTALAQTITFTHRYASQPVQNVNAYASSLSVAD